MSNDGSSRLTVRRVHRETPEIVVLDLAAEDQSTLPAWDPGAHIDLLLPSGKVRQYSLCGDPVDTTTYRVAVLRDAKGRGGSAEIHSVFAAGFSVASRGPRNHFKLVDAPQYMFVAGGIGVTPMLPMIRAAERAGRPWQLVYGGRSLGAMGFLGEISDRKGGEVILLPEDDCGLPDLESLFATLPAETAVYGCGPGGMLAALEAAAARHGRSASLHIERFAAAEAPAAPVKVCEDRAFDVELRGSGVVLHVPADASLGNVLQDAGIPVTFSCQEGYCGSCETRVLEGVPEHRDTILNDEEKAGGKIMMVCVGRSCSPRLVLDL